jgi:hypothetical protein
MIHRKNRAGAEAAAQEDQAGHETTEAPEPDPVLTKAEEFAAEAERLRTEAAGIREQAGREAASAQASLARVQEQAARMVAEAKAAAHQTGWANLKRAEHKAEEMELRAGYLARAGQLLHEMPDAGQRVTDLQAEAERLAERIATLDTAVAGHSADRDRLAAALDAASRAGRVREIQDVGGTLAATGQAISGLTAERDSARGRLLAIGDGQGAGELHAALGALRGHQGELRRLLNLIDPERPEARWDAYAAELDAIFGANMARVAYEPHDRRYQRHGVLPWPQEHRHTSMAVLFKGQRAGFTPFKGQRARKTPRGNTPVWETPGQQ